MYSPLGFFRIAMSRAKPWLLPRYEYFVRPLDADGQSVAGARSFWTRSKAEELIRKMSSAHSSILLTIFDRRKCEEFLIEVIGEDVDQQRIFELLDI